MIKKYPKQFKKVSDYLKEKFGIDVLLGQITAFMGHKNKKIFIEHNGWRFCPHAKAYFCYSSD